MSARRALTSTLLEGADGALVRRTTLPNGLRIVTEAGMRRKGEVDTAKLDALEQRIVERFDSQMSVFRTSALLLDDGVIDPRDTRAVLAQVLAICREAQARQPQAMQFSVARP